jgi:hypothetical protein
MLWTRHPGLAVAWQERDIGWRDAESGPMRGTNLRRGECVASVLFLHKRIVVGVCPVVVGIIADSSLRSGCPFLMSVPDDDSGVRCHTPRYSPPSPAGHPVSVGREPVERSARSVVDVVDDTETGGM